MGRKLGLHWIIQKFIRHYERLQKEKERKRRRISTGDSDSESDSAPPEVRPLPSNQCHVVYSQHSRTHLNPTLMHLVEFVGNNEDFNEEDRVNLAVHEDVFAVCSCSPSGDPDDETVLLYKADPSFPKIPELEDGEHFLGGPGTSVALTSTGILYSSLTPEDWTGQLKSYLGIPSDLIPGMDEMKDIQACLTEKLVGHRTRFHPKLSPATPRRSKWTEHEEEEVDKIHYLEGESATKSAQVQTKEVKESRRFILPPSALTPAQKEELSRYRNTPHPIGAVRENYSKSNVTNVTPTNPNSLPWNLIPEHDYLLLDKNIPAEQWAIYGLNIIKILNIIK